MRSLPICDECGMIWRPNGRRHEHGADILCVECYIAKQKKRGFNGH